MAKTIFDQILEEQRRTNLFLSAILQILEPADGETIFTLPNGSEALAREVQENSKGQPHES